VCASAGNFGQGLAYATDAYERLPDDLQAELPLKRVWTPAAGDDSEA